MSEQSKKFVMTAVVFRNIFFAVFALLFVTAIILAILGTNKLQATAEDVRTVVREANTIDQTNTRTIKLWDELQQSTETVDKVRQIVADSKYYAYQNVIIEDLENFARRAGITITNYDFTVANTDQAPANTPQAEGDTPTEGEMLPSDSQATGSTLKTTSVNVSVQPHVNYERLMTFIHFIEQNLTKMQISKVSLSRSSKDFPRSVESDVLTIEVYIR